MSATILPDGSVVFRLPQWTVHFDKPRGQIHLRDATGPREEEGRVLATAPVTATRRLELRPESDGLGTLYLSFDSGEGLDLGRVPLGEMGRRIAYAVARVARCPVACPPVTL